MVNILHAIGKNHIRKVLTNRECGVANKYATLRNIYALNFSAPFKSVGVYFSH